MKRPGKFIQHLTVSTLSLVFAGAAQAALFDRGGGLVYDDVLNITWLQDWSKTLTGGVTSDATGRVTLAQANTWAENLSFGGGNDWRLPSALNADGSGPCSNPLPGAVATPCSGSELGHMFYNNWGATANNAFSTGTHAAALAMFSNVQTVVSGVNSAYWTSTPGASSGMAWVFGMGRGRQVEIATESAGVSTSGFAVAVHPGDLGSTVMPLPVPEPSAYLMMLAGLGVMAGVAKRRRSHARKGRTTAGLPTQAPSCPQATVAAH